MSSELTFFLDSVLWWPSVKRKLKHGDLWRCVLEGFVRGL